MKNLSSRSWALISVLSLTGAIVCLWLGKRWEEKRAPKAPASGVAAQSDAAARPAAVAAASAGEATDAAPASTTGRFRHRLSNTEAPMARWMQNERAILLENALIDTSLDRGLAIPESLKSLGQPGAYVVQSRGPTTDAFRGALEAAGAKIVSYVPNNAYLVRAHANVASALGANPVVAAVVAYEPYFKLESGLLAEVLEPTVEPGKARLNVTVYPGEAAASAAALEALGFSVEGTERSPFGELLAVSGPSQMIAAVAREDSVQSVEMRSDRVPLTDLARTKVGISTNTSTANNWLGLSGTNVVVAVTDTGVEAGHPDLTGRVIESGFLDSVGGPITSDFDGHGTHVAGIIVTSGASFPSTTNALGSVTNANYRGMAPGAKIYPLPIDGITGPLSSDVSLQEATARTNIFVSNNSWGYRGANDYTAASASFDAATRDALPERSGSQPVLFVFAAGNSGNSDPGSTTGSPDTILSPATAKNVISVGALEQLREITNEVINAGVTNAEFLAQTDSDSQVAWFSSRGNTGVGLEGEFGRYKPDLVAPGSFVVSTRATNYVEPDSLANYQFSDLENLHLEPGQTNTHSFFVPAQATQVIIQALPIGQTGQGIPPLLIAAGAINPPTQIRGVTRVVLSVPGQLPTGLIYYSEINTNAVAVDYDVRVVAILEPESGNYSEVLSSLNEPLGPYYRYESGTSMAAPVVSGMLALMQEFFEQRLQRTNSPAMMKALLINGARNARALDYDYNPKGLVNHQGWGVPRLTNILPASLASLPETAWPVRLFDQSTTNALATGESFARTVTLSAEAQQSPIRISLVWTDPPGNPRVAAKLVNDLDLIVTNLQTKQVYFGNNFESGSRYTLATSTNSPLDLSDTVNNVENVYLPAQPGSNYVVVVRGKRVNVNAVNTQTNGTKQDFALVISTENTALSSPFSIAGGPALFTQAAPTLLTISNSVPLVGQRVGAQSPLAPVGPGGGIANQWRFYVFTNDYVNPTNPASQGTNVGFLTFLPPNLSRQRAGEEADIDLYVSTNPALTNLNPAALAGAMKSLQRGGTEQLTTNNSRRGDVYYIGVKAEDQQASDFNLFAVATDEPFNERDQDGNLIVRGFPRNLVIPDGTSDDPGIEFVAFFTYGVPDIIRRVVVTNDFYHDNFGDLFGVLTHERIDVALNNHSFNLDDTPGDRVVIYDDSDSGDMLNVVPPDGPGALRDYWGGRAGQPWVFTVIDNSLNHTGTLDRATLKIYPQLDNTTNITVTIQPGRWYYDFIDVPPEADRLNLIITYDGSAPGPVDTYLRADVPPNQLEYDKYANIVPPGGTNSISRGDIPPLRPTIYFAGLFNPNPFPITVTYRFSLDLILDGLFSPVSGDTNSAPILDDALTKSILTVTNEGRIVDMQVGLKVNHPRLSDLSFRLVSPSGTRSLLMENRGTTSSGFSGIFTEGTNALELARFAGIDGYIEIPTTNYLVASGFETNVALGTYTAPATVSGWSLVANSVEVVNRSAVQLSGSNLLVLADAVLTTNLVTVPGTTYRLSIGVKNEPLVGWWPMEGSTWTDRIGTNDGNLLAGSYVTGKVGAASSFDGNTWALIKAAPATDLGANEGFTIEAWLRVDNTNAVMPFIEFGDVPGTLRGVRVDLNSDGASLAPGHLAIHVVGTNGLDQVVATPSAVLRTNDWLHFAWTHRRDSAQSRVYVDGVPVLVTNLPVVVRPDTGLDVLVGGRGVAGFVGAVDELAFFGAALGNAEIAAIHRADFIGRGRSTTVSFGPTTKTVSVTNNAWTDYRYEFLAFTNQMSLTITGSAWCPLLDHVELFSVSTTNIPIYGTLSGDTNTLPGLVKFVGFPMTNGLGANGSNFVLGANVFYSGLEAAPHASHGPGAQFEGWTVVSGTVDVAPASVWGWVADSPPHMMDMNGVSAGTLTRPISLRTDSNYRFSFAYCRNPATVGVAVPELDITMGNRSWRVVADQINSMTSLDWIRTSFVFTANSTMANLTLTSLAAATPLSGVQLDTMSLDEVFIPKPAYLLPEETLDVFKGEEALGDWTLEITDSRTGAPVGTTSLLEWNLEFIFAPPAVTATVLTNGYLATNVVRGSEIRYFAVDVPGPATFATNILNSLSGGQLNLIFNQNVRPTGTTFGDVYLMAATTGGTRVLETNLLSQPPLLPGQRYYLGVQNTDPGETNTFTMQVFFDRLPGSVGNVPMLTNGFTLATNIAPGITVQYFAFDVSSNAVGAAFEVLRPSDDVNLVLRSAAPLPTPTSYDYLGARGGTNYEYISVLTNTAPAPLAPGRWYLGVYNVSSTNVSYGLRVTEAYFNDPNDPLLAVTDIVPDVPVPVTVGPGAVVTNFYRLRVTEDYVAALWEAFNQTGDADLLIGRGYPPSLAQHDFSSRARATNREQVVVQTDFLNPSLIGDWYIALPNNGVTNLDLALRATVSTNGLLQSSDPATTNLLVNGVPQTFSVGPGLLITNYFLFATTGNPGGVLIELFDMDGDLDLVIGKEGIPSAILNSGSSSFGLADERVLIRTNSSVTNLTVFLPNLSGNWLIATPNYQGADVSFKIRASQMTAGGLMQSSEPLELSPGAFDGNLGSLELALPTVPGEKYELQSSPDLVVWTTIQPFQATDFATILTVFPPLLGSEFYRIIQVP